MFCNKPEFESQETSEAILGRCEDPLYSVQLTAMILSWCDAHIQYRPEGYGVNVHARNFEAATVSDLRDIIDPLISASAIYEEAALWPLIDGVAVGVRDSRILKHVTLVDLPGTADTNQVRIDTCMMVLESLMLSVSSQAKIESSLMVLSTSFCLGRRVLRGQRNFGLYQVR